MSVYVHVHLCVHVCVRDMHVHRLTLGVAFQEPFMFISEIATFTSLELTQ